MFVVVDGEGGTTAKSSFFLVVELTEGREDRGRRGGWRARGRRRRGKKREPELRRERLKTEAEGVSSESVVAVLGCVGFFFPSPLLQRESAGRGRCETWTRCVCMCVRV